MNRRLYKANGIIYYGGHDRMKKRVLKPKLSKSERYQKEFMATCSICGESKPKEDFAYLNVNICKNCDFKMFKESVRCAET